MKTKRRWGAMVLLGGAVLSTALPGCGGGSGGFGTAGLVVETVAGAADNGTTDGDGATARFNNPVNVATDSAGNVFVADFDNGRVRMISTAGVVSTIVNQANFDRPFGLAVMSDGRLFVQTDANDSGGRDATTGTIWRVDIAAKTATVVARNLGRPRGITPLDSTRLVLCDLTQNDVRLLNVDTGAVTPLAGQRGTAGFADGTGTAALFSRPYGPALTPRGTIVLADQNNHRIREVTLAGVVTTLAGSTAGFRDGTIKDALFNGPQDVDVDASGNVFVSDNGNHRLRVITPRGAIFTLAGDGTAGFRDGPVAQAQFFGQEAIALSRNNRTLFIADGTGGAAVPFHRVRRIALR